MVQSTSSVLGPGEFAASVINGAEFVARIEGASELPASASELDPTQYGLVVLSITGTPSDSDLGPPDDRLVELFGQTDEVRVVAHSSRQVQPGIDTNPSQRRKPGVIIQQPVNWLSGLAESLGHNRDDESAQAFQDALTAGVREKVGVTMGEGGN